MWSVEMKLTKDEDFDIRVFAQALNINATAKYILIDPFMQQSHWNTACRLSYRMNGFERRPNISLKDKLFHQEQ